MFNYETATVDQIAARAVQDLTRTLEPARRIIEINRARFDRETDGRKLRRIRREYENAIDFYIRIYRRRLAWLGLPDIEGLS